MRLRPTSNPTACLSSRCVWGRSGKSMPGLLVSSWRGMPTKQCGSIDRMIDIQENAENATHHRTGRQEPTTDARRSDGHSKLTNGRLAISNHCLASNRSVNQSHRDRSTMNQAFWLGWLRISKSGRRHTGCRGWAIRWIRWDFDSMRWGINDARLFSRRVWWCRGWRRGGPPFVLT